MNSATEPASSIWHQPPWRTGTPAVRGPMPAGLLHDPFLAQAAATPTAAAVISKSRILTYAEANAESKCVGIQLASHGAGQGQLVGVIMEKGWEQVVACIGVLRCGAAYVPIDPRWPGARIETVVRTAGIVHILTQPWLDLDWPEGTNVHTVRPGIDETPNIPAIDEPDIAPGDLAYVIFTSGSTGVPKGVMIEHGAAANTVMDVNEQIGLGAHDRILALSALNFDLSVYDIFGPLAVGGAVVLPAPNDDRNPAAWSDLITEHQITVWNSVPALMAMMVEHHRTAPGTGPHRQIRVVLLSGDWIPVTLPAAVRDVFPATIQWSLGGATEASIWSIRHLIVPQDSDRSSIPYGTAMSGQHVFVLDSALQPRPTWVPGEIYLAGVGLSRGYLGDPERTATSFLVDPVTGTRLYRTGDWGRLLASGEIEFLGREDLQVKVGGHRIELGDVEAALLSCPGVSTAVVDAYGDRHRKRLCAHVVLQDKASITAEELKTELEERIPAYLIPADILIVSNVPLTSNGKIDRAELATQYVQRPLRATTESADGPAEQAILDVWREFFEQPALSPNDNFFELGGDSLQAIRLMAALRPHLSADAPVTYLFEAPSVRLLARRLPVRTSTTQRSEPHM